MKKEYQKSKLAKISLTASFIALGILSGYLLLFVPNVETMGLISFCAGIYLGYKRGLVVSISIYGIIGLINPLGASPLPVLTAQITGGCLYSLIGAMVSHRLLMIRDKKRTIIVSMALGFVLTLLYDILTNTAYYIIFGSPINFTVFLIGGLIFSSIHIISNAILFGLFSLYLGKIKRLLGFFLTTNESLN